jgi:hypothetical protein
MQRRRALKVIGLCVLIFVGTPVIGAFVQQWIEDSQTTTTPQSSQRKPDLTASDIDYAKYCQGLRLMRSVLATKNTKRGSRMARKKPLYQKA